MLFKKSHLEIEYEKLINKLKVAENDNKEMLKELARKADFIDGMISKATIIEKSLENITKDKDSLKRENRWLKIVSGILGLLSVVAMLF